MFEKVWYALVGEGGLLRVRGIWALTVAGIVAYLAVAGDLSAEDMKEIALVIVGFYFISRVARENKSGG